MGYARFRSTSIQEGADAYAGGIWLDFPVGLNEPATVRGEDDVIPEASGQDPGARIADNRRIQAEGHVRGVGATAAERRAHWREKTDVLKSLMDMSLAPGLLELDGDYLGIPTGETWYLNARVTRAIPGPITNGMSFQLWTFELTCIDSPPEWQVEAS